MNPDSEEVDNSHAKVSPETAVENNGATGGVPLTTPESINNNTEIDDPLDKCPPDFTWSKKHAEANMVKNLDVRNAISTDMNDEDMYCPWCRLPTDKAAPKYKLWVSVRNLEDLGAGFPLYYQLKAFTLIIYIIMFLVVGIAGLSINTGKDKATEWPETTEVTYVVDMSIGNHGVDPDNYTDGGIVAQLVLNLIMIFIIIIGSIILRRLQNKVISDIDEKNLTPSDFGVMATHLPLNKNEEEVKAWLLEAFPNLEIVYVNYCYDIKEIVRIVRKLTNLMQIRGYLVAYKEKKLKEQGVSEEEAEAREINLHPPANRYCCCCKKEYPALQSVQAAIEETESKLEKIKEEMDVNTDKDLYCGTAFIVFNRQSHANKVIKYFEVTLLRRALSFFVYSILRCKNSKIDSRYWEGQRVIIERAAEPSDIYWENLSVSTLDRVKKSLITYSITLVVLGIAFGINLGLSILKDSLDDSGGSNSSEEAAIRIISIFTSFIVVFINVVLGRVIRILSSFEKHETYSKYHLSVAFKLSVAMFINTGIVPLFVNYGRENWFNAGGLMVDIFYNTCTICFISPLVYFFNPVYFIKKCRIWMEQRKGENSRMTQRQANLLFEGPPLDMAQRYANTMLLLCMTVFYVYPLPIMPLLAGGGTIFQYWIEKYVLLRRHKIPEQMGETMAQFFSNMVPFICFLYGISLFAFSDILSEGDDKIGFVAFLITLIYLLIPVRWIINRCSSDVFRHDEMTYEKHSITFLTDYHRTNPMSEKEANMKFLEKLKDAGEVDNTQYNQQMNYFNQGGRFGGVMHYGAQVNNMQSRVLNTYQPMAFGQMPQGFAGGVMRMGHNPMQGMPTRYVVRMAAPAGYMPQGGNTVMRVGGYGGYGGMAVQRPMMVQRAAYMPRPAQVPAPAHQVVIPGNQGTPGVYQNNYPAQRAPVLQNPQSNLQQPYRPAQPRFVQPQYQQPQYQQPQYQQPQYATRAQAVNYQQPGAQQYAQQPYNPQAQPAPAPAANEPSSAAHELSSAQDASSDSENVSASY